MIETRRNNRLSVLRKVTMRVLVTHERALGLYKKLGFFVEGRFAHAIEAADGAFVDDDEIGVFVKLGSTGCSIEGRARKER